MRTHGPCYWSDQWGVDRTIHEAIGCGYGFQEQKTTSSDVPLRFLAIMVYNNVLRLNEAEQMNVMLIKDLGVDLTIVGASALYFSRLEGVEDSELKLKRERTLITPIEGPCSHYTLTLSKILASRDPVRPSNNVRGLAC